MHIETYCGKYDEQIIDLILDIQTMNQRLICLLKNSRIY